MFSHLRLQDLVEDRLQKHRHSPVALEQLLDLLAVDLDLKSSHRRSVWLLLVGLNSNLAERDGFVYPAGSVTQLSGHNPGDSLEDFLEDVPTVQRKQTVAYLELALQKTKEADACAA